MFLPTRSGRDRIASRRGTVLPLVVLTITLQVAFLALAIDLGMLAIAKTQVQQAADLVALTASRSLNGSAAANYNQSVATTNAQTIVARNYVLGKNLQPSQLQMSYGSYDYDQTAQSFAANFPALSNSPTSAVSVTITWSGDPGRIRRDLRQPVDADDHRHRPGSAPSARHRAGPGPVRIDAIWHVLGFDFYQSSRTTNNPDPLVPSFGHYSSSSAGLVGPSTNRSLRKSTAIPSPRATRPRRMHPIP